MKASEYSAIIFALVHAIHHMQLRQALERHFRHQQGFGNDADDLAAFGQGTFRQDAHQPNVSAAEHQANVAGDDGLRQQFDPIGISRSHARAGTAKHAYPTHRPFTLSLSG